jgi:hypothetical protein
MNEFRTNIQKNVQASEENDERKKNEIIKPNPKALILKKHL